MRNSGSLLRLSGLVIAGAAVAAAAGCTSGGSSTASAPASSAVASSPATSAVAAPSSAAPSSAAATSSSPHAVTGSAPATPVASVSPSSGGGGGGLAGCATRDLQVKAGIAQGAAGSVYQVIDFTNIGKTACTLYGYPGVSLAAGTPVTQVGAAATRSTVAGPATVTLQPGQVGNSLLRITQALNYPSATCSPKKTTYLQIYPPGETTPAYLAYQSTGCNAAAVKLLTVGVVQTGAGSGQ